MNLDLPVLIFVRFITWLIFVLLICYFYENSKLKWCPLTEVCTESYMGSSFDSSFQVKKKENFQEYACLFNYFSGMQMSVSIYVYVYLHIKYLLGFCQGQIYICEYSCFLLCCEEFFHFPISKNSWLFTNIAAHISHFSCIDLWAHLLTFDCKVSVIIVSLLAC